MNRRQLLTWFAGCLPLAAWVQRLSTQNTLICRGCLESAMGKWSALPRIQPIHQILRGRLGAFARETDLMMEIAPGQWRHGAVVREEWWLPQGARFIKYANVRAWQGWIEDRAGRVIGWVTADGMAIPTRSPLP